MTVKKIVYLAMVMIFVLFTNFLFASVGDNDEIRSPRAQLRVQSGTIEEEVQISQMVELANGVSVHKELIDWIEADVLGQHINRTTCQTALENLGKISSGISGFVFFKVAYDFGQQVMAHSSPDVSIPLSIVNGVLVYIPITSLGGTLSAIVFQDFVAPTSEQRANILKFKDDPRYLDKISKASAIFGGLLSAPPFTYLAISEFFPWISYGAIPIGVTMFYVKASIDVWSLIAVGKVAYSYLAHPYRVLSASNDPNGRNSLLLKISEKLTHSIDRINGLSSAHAAQLMEYLASNTEENLYRNFFVLCHPDDYLQTSVLPVQSAILKKGIKLLGAAVGAFGMACIEPLGRAAVTPCLALVSLDDTWVTPVMSWGATVTAASLMSWGTADTFGKLYDSMSFFAQKVSEKCIAAFSSYSPIEEEVNNIRFMPTSKRAMIAATATFLAAAASGMQAELSMKFLGTDGAYALTALSCSVASTFATNFWAVDTAIMAYYGRYDLRLPLSLKLQAVIDILPYFSDELLRNLDQILSMKVTNERNARI